MGDGHIPGNRINARQDKHQLQDNIMSVSFEALYVNYKRIFFRRRRIVLIVDTLECVKMMYLLLNVESVGEGGGKTEGPLRTSF